MRSPTAKLALVAIVIPIFRIPLTRAEQTALERCIAVLGRYPTIVMAPETLDLGEFLQKYPQLNVETFPDRNFANAYSYNRLMLSDDLYARFDGYEYILIHQLDAFVFSDRLEAWCRRGYDYIGAPWVWSTRRPTTLYRLYVAALRILCRLIASLRPTARKPDRFFYRQLNYAAGNGGLSLRRVARMRAVLAKLDRRAEHYRSAAPNAENRPTGRWGEDVFFSVEANRYRKHAKTPGLTVAAHFAWEMNPAIAAQVTGGALPFGCHGWDKLYRAYWRPVFAQLGYTLDDVLDALPVSGDGVADQKRH